MLPKITSSKEMLIVASDAMKRADFNITNVTERDKDELEAWKNTGVLERDVLLSTLGINLPITVLEKLTYQAFVNTTANYKQEVKRYRKLFKNFSPELQSFH